jgi:cbb3-type cytochrome oxidase subunit 3
MPLADIGTGGALGVLLLVLIVLAIIYFARRF